MKVECVSKVSRQISLPVSVADEVVITLEGDFEAIVELLRQINFDYIKATELHLK